MLQELIGKIRDLRATMKIDVQAADIKVRSGVEAQVRNATAELPKVEEEYRKTVLNNILLIGVVGDQCQEFANISKYVFKTLAIDANVFTNRFHDALRARGARNEFNNSEMFMMLEELNKFKMEHRILDIPRPDFTRLNTNLMNSPTLETIDKIFVANYGYQLHTIALSREIANQALKAEFTGKLLPVIIFSKQEFVLDKAILKDGLFHVYKLEGEQSDATVKQVLDDVKKKLNDKLNVRVQDEIAPEIKEKKVEAPAAAAPEISEEKVEVSQEKTEEKVEVKIEAKNDKQTKKPNQKKQKGE